MLKLKWMKAKDDLNVNLVPKWIYSVNGQNEMKGSCEKDIGYTAV